MRTHYELLPDGTLFVIPIRRSLAEVMQERAKVAVWFSTDPKEAEVLNGVCTIVKASIALKKNMMTFEFPTDLPANIECQDKIDVFNNLTADQVIADYRKSIAKRKSGPIV